MKSKKIIAIAAAVAMSAMGTTSFAMQTITGNNGVVLEAYNSAVEEVPSVEMPMDIDFTFNLTVPAYPKFVYLASTSGNRNLVLDKGQHVIQMEFDKNDSFDYFTLYDVTEGDYLFGSSYSMESAGMVADVYRLSNLPGGHTYRITLSSATNRPGITGRVFAY